MKLKTITLFLISFWTSFIYAQNLDLAIVAGTSSPYGETDKVNAITIDANKNLYVTGNGSESIVFGAGENNETTLHDGLAFVAKYNPEGQLIWVRELGTWPNGITPNDIQVSYNGDVYITGYFLNEAKIFGTDTSMVGDASTAFLLKYDNDGNFSWYKSIYGSYANGFRIKIDKNDNIYCIGLFSENIVFDKNMPTEKTFQSRGAIDIYFAQYTGDGALNWALTMGGTGDEFPEDLVIKDNESIYVAGNFGSDLEIGDHSNPDTTLNEGYYSGFLARFKLNGEFDFAAKTAYEILSMTNLNENLIIGGRFTGNLNFTTESGFITVPNSSNSNVFIASLNDKGYANWAKGIYSDGYEQGIHLASDSLNHFYMTMTFDDTITLGTGTRNELTVNPIGGTNYQFANFLVTGFYENGDFLWANQVYGDGGFPNGLCSDLSGTTYLATTFTDTTMIKSGYNQVDTLVAKGYADLLIARFNPYFNQPPYFSFDGETTRNEDFTDTVSIQLILDSIPENEAYQVIHYSIDSTNNDLVNYTFDSTGSLIITAKKDKFGSQIFYISADDGAAENYKASNPFTFEITPVNDAPVITGLAKELSTDEDIPLELKISDLTIDDPDNVFPDDFTLIIYGGENYSFVNTTLTPTLNFHGVIQVSSTISDGTDVSVGYFIEVLVNSVNDIPVITSVVDTLNTFKNTTFELKLDYFTVEDPDNTFPDDFSLVIADGDNYTHDGNIITPTSDFVGNLTILVQVSDGTELSGSTDVLLEVRNGVGIQTQYNNGFQVCPNPFTHQVVITLENEQMNGQLQIYDLSGLVVYTKPLNGEKEVTLNLDELSKGIYFIHLMNGNSSIVQKMIKV